jgi:hypothetical protein
MHGGVNPQIQFAPPVKDRAAQLLHGDVDGNVHRGKRGVTARRLDRIVKLFQGAGGFSNGNNMVGGGQCARHCRAKTARCACDQNSFGHDDAVVFG